MNYKNTVFYEFIITSMLVGLIWVIQFVTYPGFLYLTEIQYSQFHLHHTQAITPLVAPLMLFEFFLAITNLIQKNYNPKFSYLGISLLVVVWFCTAFISVPIHNELILGKNELLIKKLILTNWIRTISWTLRLGIFFKIFKLAPFNK